MINKKNKTENSYVNIFKQKSDVTYLNENNTTTVNKEENKKGINFDDLKSWNEVKYFPNTNHNRLQENLTNKTPIVSNHLKINSEILPINHPPEIKYSKNVTSENITNDEFSVNTSYFTNRFGELGNNIDKFELSQVNPNTINIESNFNSVKKLNFGSSSEGIAQQVHNFNLKIKQIEDYEIIEEDEEELKNNHSKDLGIDPTQIVKINSNTSLDIKTEKNTLEIKNKIGLDDSLEESDFPLNIDDAMNVTQDQLNDMNKELKDINRKIKLKEREEKKRDNFDIFTNKDSKRFLEPIVNKKLIEKKSKRKNSPYLRNVNTTDNTNTNNEFKYDNKNIISPSPATSDNNKPASGFTNIPQNIIPVSKNYIPINYTEYPNLNIPNISNMMQYPNPYIYPPFSFMSTNINNIYGTNNPNINYTMIPGLPGVTYPCYTNYTQQENIQNKNIQCVNTNTTVNPSNKFRISSKNKKTDNKSANSGNNKINACNNPLLSPKGTPIVNYKPYSVKEYKEKFKTLEKSVGGLGPNIGSKQWEENEEKKKKIKEYSDHIKNLNKLNSKEEKIKCNKNLIDDTKQQITFNEQMADDSLSIYDKNLEKDLKSVKKDSTIITPDNDLSKGYSHIHNLRKLKIVNKEKPTPADQNLQKIKSKYIRPKSFNKISSGIKNRSESKIYTTLHEEKINKNENESFISKISGNIILNNINNNSNLNLTRSRAVSGKPSKSIKSESKINLITKNKPIDDEENVNQLYKNTEIEALIQNHNIYHDKVEKIRNFINKH